MLNHMGDLWLPSSTRLTLLERLSHICLFYSYRADLVSKRFPYPQVIQWQAPIRRHAVDSEVAPKEYWIT